MRRSKLESCEAILETLLKKPLTIDQIAFRTNMNCTTANRHLDFLLSNGLVEERIAKKKTSCAITERGATVFKTLNFQKYLKRMSEKLMVIDDALQTIPFIVKRNQESLKE